MGMSFAGGSLYKPPAGERFALKWSESGELRSILAAAAVTDIKLYPPV